MSGSIGPCQSLYLPLHIKNNVKVIIPSEKPPGQSIQPHHNDSFDDGADKKIKIYNYESEISNKDSPYRNLSEFGPGDAAYYFGRQKSIKELSTRVKKNETNIISLIGPSGSGKSSLVLAGLIPCLYREDAEKKSNWLFTYCKLEIKNSSGSSLNPFMELAYSLLLLMDEVSITNKTNQDVKKKTIEFARNLETNPSNLKKEFEKIQKKYQGKRLLIIIEQFEKLYTHTSVELQNRFIKLLLEASAYPSKPNPIVILLVAEETILAEIVNENNKRFKDLFLDKPIRLTNINRDDLKLIIEEPAKKYKEKYTVVSQVTEEIEKFFDKTDDYSRVLPLIEVTMSMLWNHRDEENKIIKWSGEFENFDKAIEKYAEEAIEKLIHEGNLEKEEKIFSILRSLVEVDKNGKSKSKSLLVNNFDKEERALIAEMANVKLILKFNDRDIASFKIIHESLLLYWPKLNNWIEENKKILKDVTRLVNTAREWKGDSNLKSNSFFINPSTVQENFIKICYLLTRYQSFFTSDEYGLIKQYLHARIKYSIKKNIIKFSIILIIISLFLNWGIEKEYEKIGKPRISLGQVRFFPYTDYDKKQGTEAFRKYFEEKQKVELDSIIKKFTTSMERNIEDPEVFIYLNNAKVERDVSTGDKKIIKIAIVVPIGGNKDVAREMLFGAALAQVQFNEDGFKNHYLQVLIVNDDNDARIAGDIAKYLSKKEDEIIAVIGHNSSDATLQAAGVYQKYKIPMLSPTSFVMELNGQDIRLKTKAKDNYIFSIGPSHESYSDAILNKVEYDHKRKDEPLKILFCHDTTAHDQEAFKKNFEKAFGSRFRTAGELIKNPKCDFSEVTDFVEIQKLINKDKAIKVIFVAPHVNRIRDSIIAIDEISKMLQDRRLSFYSSPTLYTNSFLSFLEERNIDKLDLTLVTGWYPDKNNKLSTSLKDQYPDLKVTNKQKLSSFITWRTAMTYDAVNVLMSALKKLDDESTFLSPRTLRAEIQKKLADKDFKYKEGITGAIEFFTNCEKEPPEKVPSCAPGKRKDIKISLVGIGQKIKEQKNYQGYEFKKVVIPSETNEYQK